MIKGKKRIRGLFENRKEQQLMSVRWWLKQSCDEIPEYELIRGKASAGFNPVTEKLNYWYEVRWINPNTGLYDSPFGRSLDPIQLVWAAYKHHRRMDKPYDHHRKRGDRPVYDRPGNPNFTKAKVIGHMVSGKFIPIEEKGQTNETDKTNQANPPAGGGGNHSPSGGDTAPGKR